MSVYTISECALGIGAENPRAARLMAESLRATGWFTEVVPGIASVAVAFEPDVIPPSKAEAALIDALRAVPPGAEPGPGNVVSLKISYGGDDGPDLEAVAKACGLTAREVIERHGRANYTAEILGFTPGFAYLGGLPTALSTERLSSPRVSVPAGSVGIAGGFCGVYALDGPGGWPIIGRVRDSLVNWEEEPPFLLTPGTSVSFEPS